jgi:hypothetical protein
MQALYKRDQKQQMDPALVKKPFMSERLLRPIGMGGFASEVSESCKDFKKSFKSMFTKK